MKKKMKCIKNEKAMSLVELISALAILVILSGAIFSIYRYASNLQVKAEMKSTSSNISEEIIGSFEVAQTLGEFETDLSNDFQWTKLPESTDERQVYRAYYDSEWNIVSSESESRYIGTAELDHQSITIISEGSGYIGPDGQPIGEANAHVIIEATDIYYQDPMLENELDIDSAGPNIKLQYDRITNNGTVTIVVNGNHNDFSQGLIIFLDSDTEANPGKINVEIDESVDVPVYVVFGIPEGDDYQLNTTNINLDNQSGENTFLIDLSQEVQEEVNEKMMVITVTFSKTSDGEELVSYTNYKYGELQ